MALRISVTASDNHPLPLRAAGGRARGDPLGDPRMPGTGTQVSTASPLQGDRWTHMAGGGRGRRATLALVQRQRRSAVAQGPRPVVQRHQHRDVLYYRLWPPLVQQRRRTALVAWRRRQRHSNHSGPPQAMQSQDSPPRCQHLIAAVCPGAGSLAELLAGSPVVSSLGHRLPAREGKGGWRAGAHPASRRGG